MDGAKYGSTMQVLSEAFFKGSISQYLYLLVPGKDLGEVLSLVSGGDQILMTY